MKNATSFELVIPEDVESKIRHLCNRVHDIEWSGTLFYKVEGSLDDGTFKATCLDICVMDIGTSGYTEFNDTSDIINYRIEHNLLQPGIYEALIHSHNCMQSFFSQTDENTLIQEGTDLNHFLSLIVNNAGNYVARITRKLNKKIKAEAVITTTESCEYQTFENKTVVLSQDEKKEETKTQEFEESVIEYFELTIDKAEVEDKFQELDNRLSEIRESKKKVKAYDWSKWDSWKKDNPIGTQNNRYVFSDDEDGFELNDANSSFYYKHEDNKKEEPKQLSMFENHVETSYAKKTETSYKPPFQALEPDDEFPYYDFYKTENVPVEITKNLCIQLLTGSILAVPTKTFDFKSWVTKMDERYERRFGKLTDTFNFSRLEVWVENFIDSIIGYTVDEKYENSLAIKYNLGRDYDYNDSDSFMMLYASNMIEFLSDLPQSNVKEVMIQKLLGILPGDYCLELLNKVNKK